MCFIGFVLSARKFPRGWVAPVQEGKPARAKRKTGLAYPVSTMLSSGRMDVKRQLSFFGGRDFLAEGRGGVPFDHSRRDPRRADRERAPVRLTGAARRRGVTSALAVRPAERESFLAALAASLQHSGQATSDSLSQD